MRADTEIVFVTFGNETYNEDTGDWEITDDIYSNYYANVSDTGTDRMAQLYGGLKRHAKTIRLNEVIDGKFDHILIDGKKYKSDMRRIYRHKTVIEVSGV